MLRNSTLVAMFLLAGACSICFTAASLIAENATDETDRSIKPGDDFYRYANGSWLRSVKLSEGQASYDSRAIVNAKANERVRQLVQAAAAGHPAKGSVPQKVGDYYASFLDEDAIEARGMKPLAHEMTLISAITNKASLAAYLGTTLNSEVEDLTANSDHIFGLWINQGFTDASHNVVHLWQGGLGMPERDNYLDPSPKKVELRAQYQTHIAAVLKLASIAAGESSAPRILALEIQIAQAFAPDEDAADVFKQNNLWRRSDFAAKAPGLDWDLYLKAAGLEHENEFVVWQPSAVIGISALVARENTEVWKDYLRFHLVEHYARVLPKAVAAEHFAFNGTILSDIKQIPDRSKVAIAATNGALGQAVGQLYMQSYFGPQAKAKAQAMAGDLLTAYRTRIANLTWMSSDTKGKALAKLAAFEIYIGYPDTWNDYTDLEIVRGDAFGNMQRAEAFNRQHNLARLRQPVTPIDWPMNPHVPGAVIMFSPNAEFFSAGILQPPYFDPDGDTASNYGSAGAGVAHEISHSFDELGNIYDAHGRLGEWWTAEDKTSYQAAAAKLVAQLDKYCPFPDTCVHGKQVLTESIADLAGLLVAHDAYILSMKGKPDVVIGGLTGEQRFFLAFAQRWRKVQSEAATRQQIKTDTHPPGEYRSDTVRNVEAWYRAFEVVPGDKLYLAPEARAGIW